MVISHLPVAPGVLRIEMWYELGGQSAVNVYHLQNVELWTVEALSICASDLINWERDIASRRRSNQCRLTLLRIVDLTSPTGVMLALKDPESTTGQMDSPPLPQNVTVAIQGQTDVRGAGRQARTYWLGLCQDQVEGSTLTETAYSQITEVLASLLATLNSHGVWHMAVLHRTLDGVKLDPAFSSPIVRWLIRDAVTDSQYSRLPNHKRSRR